MPAPLAGPDRFAAVAAAVADPVRRYLWRRTDSATADDALTATLSTLRRRSDDLPEDDPVPWATGVARLELQNARRMQRRQVMLAQRIAVVDPPQVQIDDAEGASTADERTRLVLARLRDSDAELLHLWAWEEFDVRGIAVVLGVPADTVSIRLHRARRSFAELYDSLDPHPPEATGQMTGTDDEDARRLLRAVDPARSLPPLSRDELAEHIAIATGARTTRPRRRSPWLIVGVGALSAAAAASLLLPFALGVGGGSTSTLTLPSTGGPSAMCSPVTAAALAPAQLAFRAEVRSIDRRTVTLRVLERFAGEVGDSVTVGQGRESAVDGAPIAFETGVDYLIAADGDTILTCGLSGQSSPELAALYREAFARQ
ncbi:sigma-70 family RNA polymerase sigma factor [Rathayibacter tanaceti]|uniref:RNA polymerase sigma factor (Sigma-70 family) n=4 Tax=Rathayibacter tanaceti TaxID=1671680 RepID=A0AAE6RIF1_9MICO|nr:sigma-70 family RNA polymerase sigma factor [Rathayibacter tanaceti]QHC54626.1 hypothetical protein GSU10_02455 [Rathayibacter tanaceti]